MQTELPQFLYHYTTVETLALILETKKLRFNSLLNVDDLEEVQTRNLTELGKYCFVSCFTDSLEESIPIWNMYSNRGGGVRLRLQTNSLFHSPSRVNQRSEQALATANAVVEIVEGAFRISSDNETILLKEIMYTNNEDELFPYVEFDSNASFSDQIVKYVGINKRSCWDFQKEWRFIKIIHPGNEEAIRENQDVYTTYKDVDLNIEALNNLQITLGYNTSAGNRIIVNNLVNSYNRGSENANITVRDSVLTNRVR